MYINEVMNTATKKAKATNLYTNNKIPDLPQLYQSKATYILFLLVLLQCRTEGDGAGEWTDASRAAYGSG